MDEWRAFESRDELPEPKKQSLAGSEALVTDVLNEDGTHRLRVVTTFLHGRRFELSFQSEVQDLSHSTAQMRQVTAGIRFPTARQPTIESTAEVYIDKRLGLGLRAHDSKWKGQPIELPAQVAALGSGHLWSTTRGRQVLFLAIGSEGTSDPAAAAGPVLNGLVSSVGGTIERSKRAFMGKEVELAEHRGGRSPATFVVVPYPGRVLVVGGIGISKEAFLKSAAKLVVIED